MQSKRFYRSLVGSAVILGLAAPLAAQQPAPTLTVAPVPTVKARKGSVVVVSLRAVLPPGFHAKSDTPIRFEVPGGTVTVFHVAYLVPLTLKWAGSPLQAEGITYPKGAAEKFSFSPRPLSMVTGEFTITTKFKVPANAATGASAQNGTLRYQACNDRTFFEPKTLNVTFALNIE